MATPAIPSITASAALDPPKAAAPTAPLVPAEAVAEAATEVTEAAPVAPEVAEVVRLREEATEDWAAATEEEGTAVLLLTVAVPSEV